MESFAFPRNLAPTQLSSVLDKEKMIKYKKLEGVGPSKNKAKLWRYMNFDKFKGLLSKKSLYFASAREYDDAFEGSITQRHYDFRLKQTKGMGLDFIAHTSNAFYELTRLTKINCWHLSDYESTAMWKLYVREGKGIAIQTTYENFKKSLLPYRIKENYSPEDIHIGKVKYINYRSEIMDDKSMLGMFFYKRKSFSYENEVRAVISLRMAEEFGVNIPEKGISVPVNLHILIENIYLSPEMDNGLTEEVKKLLNNHQYGFTILKSELDDEAVF